MKHKTKLLALMLAVVTVFTATALVACTPEDLFYTDETDSETEISTSDTLSVEPQSNPYISLSASPVTVSVTEKATTLTQTLTATIIPVTAANKEVDWSVAWADTANTRNVTDYLTVTPKSSGSTTATVACFKPFEGNIIITVTTRDSGFWAQCVVDYVGKPTDMVFTTTLTPRRQRLPRGSRGQLYLQRRPDQSSRYGGRAVQQHRGGCECGRLGDPGLPRILHRIGYRKVV